MIFPIKAIHHHHHHHCTPSTLTNILSLYARACHDGSIPRRSYSRCLHNISRPSIVNCIRSPNPHRHFSDTNTIGQDVFSPETETSQRHRKTTLKYGRARRKWDTRERRKKSPSLDNDENNMTKKTITNNNDGPPKSDKQEDDDDGGIRMFGQPVGNPLRERYILSQRLKKAKYPRTIEGWKTLGSRVWKKYMWTFEGFLLAEKHRMDDKGNIIPLENQKAKGGDVDDEDDKSLRDKATEAADQVSNNLQKNISTLKEEAPKLVQMGKDTTGISTKEELREWVSAQLKLGTECLSEFMKGYRKGRDEEIDRMLHEYFKELDEQTEPEKDESADVTVEEDDAVNGRKRQKRTWGRRERRRSKGSRERDATSSVEGDTPSENIKLDKLDS